jgi:phosphonate transport system permease protein
VSDAAPPATNESSRPAKPRPRLFPIAVAFVAIALTVVTAWDWEYGTGFSIREIFVRLRARNPVISAIPDTNLDQLFSPRLRRAFVETLRLAIVSTVAGAIVALPMALWSTRFGAPTRVVRVVVRGVANVIRAFPDVLWAMLFVAAVGIGVLPGLLALFFFTIAVVVKLTADTLDGIDTGPIEAADASGAGHSQMLRTAAVPQILPAYTSFVLYAFELNLRASAVIGLVGAGGIGEWIKFYSSLDRWEAVWGIVVMFVIIVFVVDQLSAWLRRRLV